MPITRVPHYAEDEDGSLLSHDKLLRMREKNRESSDWTNRVVRSLNQGTQDSLGDDTLWEGRDTARDPDGAPLPKDKGIQWEAERDAPYMSTDEYQFKQHYRPHFADPASLSTGKTMNYDADVDMGRNVTRRVEVIEVDDSGPIQMVKCMGLADEYFELPLRGQPHGFTGNPRVGAIGYVMMANGRPDQAFLMGLEHPDDRKKDREAGETTMYASPGQEINGDKDGNWVIKSQGGGTVHINPL